MDPSFTSGRGVTLEDREEWSTISPLPGMIVEVDMLKTNRFVNAIAECWAAYFIKSVSNEVDGSYVLEVHYMGCEEAEEHAALTLVFKSGAKLIHLCLGTPCIIVGGLDAIHATSIRLWAVEEFDAPYVEKHVWKTLKLWQKELARAEPPKRRAKAAPKAKNEPKKTRKKDPEEGEKRKPRTGKGIDDATKAKLQAKLKKVRELRDGGGRCDRSPVEDILDSEEDGCDGSDIESSGYSPTPPLNTGSTLEATPSGKRKLKDKGPSGKEGTVALYRGTRGVSSKGLTGQLVEKALAVQDVREKAKKKTKRKSSVCCRRSLWGVQRRRSPKTPRRKRRRRRKGVD